MAIRVVLCDDHALIRAGIRGLLESAGYAVVAEAGDGRESLLAVRDAEPDVAIVDLSMPLLNGLEAIAHMAKTSPGTRVVVVSMFEDEEYVRRAQEAGAWGYVAKDDASTRLIDVVSRVAAGERCLHCDPCETEKPLSPREREVLQLIAEGKTNEQIAAVMSRSVHTVRNHRARLMRKAGARNAVELVRIAEERGWTRLAAVGRGQA
jgi:DNA-binding NarL/FixJ family response regulator